MPVPGSGSGSGVPPSLPPAQPRGGGVPTGVPQGASTGSESYLTTSQLAFNDALITGGTPGLVKPAWVAAAQLQATNSTTAVSGISPTITSQWQLGNYSGVLQVDAGDGRTYYYVPVSNFEYVSPHYHSRGYVVYQTGPFQSKPNRPSLMLATQHANQLFIKATPAQIKPLGPGTFTGSIGSAPSPSQAMAGTGVGGKVLPSPLNAATVSDRRGPTMGGGRGPARIPAVASQGGRNLNINPSAGRAPGYSNTTNQVAGMTSEALVGTGVGNVLNQIQNVIDEEIFGNVPPLTFEEQQLLGYYSTDIAQAFIDYQNIQSLQEQFGLSYEEASELVNPPPLAPWVAQPKPPTGTVFLSQFGSNGLLLKSAFSQGVFEIQAPDLPPPPP